MTYLCSLPDKEMTMSNNVVSADVLEGRRAVVNLKRGIVFALERFSEARQYQKDWIFQDVPTEFMILFLSAAQELCEIVSGKKGDEAMHHFGRSLSDSGKRHLITIIDLYQLSTSEGDSISAERKEETVEELFSSTFLLLQEFLIQCGHISVAEVETRFHYPSLPVVSF